MFLVLFGVGLLITAAGFVTIGFGIPINAFSLGNTLIIAGTVAVVGGLVLIGLAGAVRQLNRIAEALNGRPVARSAPAPVAETHVPPARIAPAPRSPLPPKPVEAVMPRPPEPRVPAASNEPSGPLDWLRPKSHAGNELPPAAEPPMMEVPDEAPLSPRVPQRPLFSPPLSASPAGEPHAEPKVWSPARGNGTPEPMPKTEAKPESFAPASRAEQVARMTPSMERPKDAGKEPGRPAGQDAGLFDVVWPDARSKPMATEPAKREAEQASMSRPQEEKRPDAPSQRPVAILKSGVIDGMAYTLYADGSIEAELPQGTVRFASVDALRAHLEKSA
jgi:hypothetical protein